MNQVICICFGFALVLLASASDCPSSCDCRDGLMLCTGRTSLVNHTEIPENVTSIKYESCSFKEISTPLMYTSILKLKIVNSGVENISGGVFADMNALTILDLRNNSLGSLPSSVFSGLVSLKCLFLSRNQLSTLPESIFSTMPSLIHVELDDNKPFHFASEMFFNASSSLSKISCKRCGISELTLVTEALAGVVNLNKLSLSGNSLSSLTSSALAKIPHLQILDLGNCSTRAVNDTSFAKLTQLRSLDLSHNLIDHLPSDAFVDSKSTLQVVLLNDNRLKTLDEKFLEWSSITQLRLDNNPWICDCSLIWIHGYVHDGFSKNATCVEPESVNGSSIFSYSMSCEDKGSSIVVLAIVIPIIVICVVVIGCFVFRVIQTMVNRKRHAREKSSFRYSAVYKETVEPAAGQKSKPVTGQSYRPKQDLEI